MWLYIPEDHSPASASVPASECSITDLTLPLAECYARSCWWRGKRSAARTWRTRWSKVSWLRRLSGLTLTPSQAQSAVSTWSESLTADLSTSSSAESPANHGPLPENDKALMTRVVEIYGRQRLKRLKHINPNAYLSKTYLVSQVNLWDSEESPVISEHWVTALRQDYSVRKNAARVTDGNGALSWRTPKADVEHQAPSQCDSTGKPQLPMQAVQFANWKTPADDDHASNWPTPNTRDDHNLSLGNTDRMQRKAEQGWTIDLNDTAANWPTPSSRDHKGGYSDEAMIRKDGKSRENDLLPQSAERFASPITLPPETTSDLGLLLQRWTPPSCPRLNPRMASWLMGIMPELICFERLETVATPWWSRMRSLLFSLVSQWEVTDE